MSPAEDLATMRYARMRWNTPLSEAHGALLIDRLAVPATIEATGLLGEEITPLPELDDQLREYVCVHRGLLGMAYLMLGRLG